MGSRDAAGAVRQAAYPYAIDSVMRIVHSLVLAEPAADSCCTRPARCATGGRFFFGGIRRGQDHDFAPGAVRRDVVDRRDFLRAAETGRLPGLRHAVCRRIGQAGENIAAPIAALYFLRKGRATRSARSTRRSAARRCCAIFCFLPTNRAWSKSCSSRRASSSRGCRFTS